MFIERNALTDAANLMQTETSPARSNDLGCGCLPWYVIQAVPSQLYIAFSKLSSSAPDRAPFRCHFPRLVVGRKTVMKHGRPVIVDGARQVTERIEPLFPGYFFVTFDVARAAWGAILRTEGVSKLISRRSGDGWTPTRLPSGLVEGLQARGRAGDGVIDNRAPTFPVLPAGAIGHVKAGLFAGMDGVTEMASGDRVRVLVSFFGRDTTVELRRADFEAVG